MQTIFTVTTTDEDSNTTAWKHAYRSLEQAKAAVEREDEELREECEVDEDDIPACVWIEEDGSWCFRSLGDETWRMWEVQATELHD